jgi:endonuclease I
MKWIKYILVFLAISAYGQVPPGYYDSAEGLSGQQLRTALHDIIDDHQAQSYSSLWTWFQTTDDRPDGKVWDMYSDVPGGSPAYSYTFGSDQCGSYGSEGDCYNREHSFPSSWFNDATPMITDLFHIYPTDGYVNGMRSNYPFGEVASPSWTSTNGSKLGNCSFPGYSGTVFEPVDGYKGDFARSYFYMVTRYMDLVDGWSSDMLSGDDLAQWAKQMLVQWDSEDPVSQKEIERNNTVYQIQENRNPYIDHPEYVGMIWGSAAGVKDHKENPVKIWYSNGFIHLSSPVEFNGELQVSDLGGRIVNKFQINGLLISVQSSLTEGIYIVKTVTKKDFSTYKLLIGK